MALFELRAGRWTVQTALGGLNGDLPFVWRNCAVANVPSIEITGIINAL
jgi:hypothetical protein